jgi:hypothetical protein
MRFLVALFWLVPVAALAQQPEPLPPFVVDLRGNFERYKEQPSVATDLGVTTANLPRHSFGLSGGVHFYPWHLGIVTFGLGGHALFANASETPEPVDDGTGTPPPPSPTVETHFRSLATELSFNFGHRNGWSYISGGLGRSILYHERTDFPVSNPPGRQTFNYGAGARWFTNRHIAVSLDLRWYSVSEQPASPTGGVAQPHTTLLVLSGGVGIR